LENLKVVEHRDFFTACYTTMLTTADIDNDKILKESKLIQSKDSGRKLTNLGGWQSNDVLEEELNNYPEMKKMVLKAMDICLEIYKLWQIGDTVYFDNMWINMNNKHDFNLKHVHPRSYFSVVYYVKTNETAGDILFYRPDTQEHYIDSPTPNEYTNKKLQIRPKDGLLLCFPSYLPHIVYPNESDEERVSIAINFK
jgi:uncharacterized protein (TIGR02466 family)